MVEPPRKGSIFEISEERFGEGREIAVVVSVARPAMPQARAYVNANLPAVGQLISFTMPGGPGQQSVAAGAHAAALAEQIAHHLRAIKAGDPDVIVHIFPACPNTMLFYLGQNHQGIAPCIVYEFDFDRLGNKTYQPSIVME